MNKNIWLAIVIAIVIIISTTIAIWFCQNRQVIQPDTNTSADLIKVEMPISGSTVSSPFEIQGEARGNWYFEADFPIKLYDDQGNLLASSVASAQGDWMTENFVPFKATISYTLLEAADGFLVLEKDNPSGLAENYDELKIPVRLSASADQATVKVFFSNSNLGSDIDCSQVYSVDRQIEQTPAIARAALEELFKGVNDEEYNQGYRSNLNQGIKIQGLVVDNGTARVDFSSELDYNVGGSCMVAAISAQISQTLKQFPTVNEVEISIDGRTEDILQP